MDFYLSRLSRKGLRTKAQRPVLLGQPQALLWAESGASLVLSALTCSKQFVLASVIWEILISQSAVLLCLEKTCTSPSFVSHSWSFLAQRLQLWTGYPLIASDSWYVLHWESSIWKLWQLQESIDWVWYSTMSWRSCWHSIQGSYWFFVGLFFMVSLTFCQSNTF